MRTLRTVWHMSTKNASFHTGSRRELDLLFVFTSTSPATSTSTKAPNSRVTILCAACSRTTVAAEGNVARYVLCQTPKARQERRLCDYA